MPTGNEVKMYADIGRIADALAEIGDTLTEINRTLDSLDADMASNTRGLEETIERVVTAVEKYGS